MHDLSLVVFRGEREGVLKASGGNAAPYFFAERYDQAELYAGRGTEPLMCVIQGASALDLTEPSRSNPVHVAIVEELKARYDDWTCRYSGQPRDAWSYIEEGDLYDYEGTGLGGRWRSLWSIALDRFDALRVLDRTDGTNGQACAVWVTPDPANIRQATLGEQLAAKIALQPWADVAAWLERDHSELLNRVDRLRSSETMPRLDRLQGAMPARKFEKLRYTGGHVNLWRTLPSGKEIRPGDWVAIDRSHADDAAVLTQNQGELVFLERVPPEDVFFAGTDEHKFSHLPAAFFYLPTAWRIEASSTEDYFKQLSPEQLRILCDGEMAQITRHHQHIEAVKAHVLSTFDQQACGTFHGPEHWTRVSAHGHAVARSLGEDPLVAHVFGWVHDSQREDEGFDLEHGPRAAAFIEAHRTSLFAFLGDEQVKQLAHACDLHSNGMTQGPALVRACWDADRLDLWRVDIEPCPRYLCTDYAKSETVIADAMRFFCESKGQIEAEIEVEDVDRQAEKDQ